MDGQEEHVLISAHGPSGPFVSFPCGVQPQARPGEANGEARTPWQEHGYEFSTTTSTSEIIIWSNGCIDVDNVKLMNCPDPTPSPTLAPTAKPTASPTANPTAKPTAAPTAKPTASPTANPTAKPTASPTASPTSAPTPSPTFDFQSEWSEMEVKDQESTFQGCFKGGWHQMT